MKKKPFSSIIGLIFGTILIFFFVIEIISPDKGFSPKENRVLQELPRFSLTKYIDGRFEKNLENWSNDQFPFRNFFVKINSSTERTLGKLESNGVYLSKDNYLIENIAKPDKLKMNHNIVALKKFKKRYPQIPMYFMLVPNAGNILENKLPASVHLNDQNCYIDNYFHRMKKIGIKPIDVRVPLKKISNTEQIYYRTDHHWTTDGAYAAYQYAILQLKAGKPLIFDSYPVKKDFSGSLASKSGFTNGKYDTIKLYIPTETEGKKHSLYNFHDTKKRTTSFYQMKNLKKKDAYTVFGGDNHPIYTVKTPTSKNRRLLLVKDSYANCMIPFLSQHYREIVVVDPRYYFDNIDSIMNTEGINQVLFLFNANTYFVDESISVMLE